MADANESKVVRRRRKRRSVFYPSRRRKQTPVNKLIPTNSVEVDNENHAEIPSSSPSTSQQDCGINTSEPNAQSVTVSDCDSTVSLEAQLDNETVTSAITVDPSIENSGQEEGPANTAVQGDDSQQADTTMETSSATAANEGSEKITGSECPICLETCVLPSKLPCSHVFCYLCIKGTTSLRGKCPMCRADIPHHYTINPELMPSTTHANEETEMDIEPVEKFAWFYEGRRGGWWQFESRMSDMIEENQGYGISRFDMMICGELYVIDTVSNIQYPKDYPRKTRKLLRDLPSRVHRKGIAGIHSYNLPSTSSSVKH